MSDQDDPRSESAGGQPSSEGERRRYFAESMGAGQSGNRHRRRRAPGDPTTTGSIPIVRVGDSLPDPTIEYRTPERPAGEPSPYFEVRHRPTEVEGLSFTSPRTYRPEPPVVEPPAAEPPAAEPPAAEQLQTTPEPTGLFDILDATHEDIAATPPIPAESPEPLTPQAPVAPPVPEYEYQPPEPVSGLAAMDDEVTDPNLRLPEILDSADADAGIDAEYVPGADDDRPMPARKRNRKVIVSVLAIAMVMVLVLAGVALNALGVFESSTDYDDATGHGAALVEVQSDASIRDIGQTLADAGVVGSKKAFVNATGNDTVAAGFYKLPKGISAAAAVEKMQGNANRVGFMIIPEGRQLDSKKGADGKTTPGIFQLIADATAVKTDDATYGVTVEDLMKAADTASADELGIPSWARETFDKLGNDHRRIEGLIASGAWENLNPESSPVELLHSLITDSAKRFTAWGLESDNKTGLTPYQTLVTASIVEREASVEGDFAKVSRVILNRLTDDQRLEMDSTANYTANIQNIDLSGAAYKDENAWNTYQHKGLPITPIGSVGERALHATLNPADGDWRYFVTVDRDGKTLFSRTFEQHKKNRQVACDNRLLVTGCE